MGEVFPAINFPWLINGQGEPLRQPTPTQTANVGNTIGAMHGGTVHYTAEQCVQELAACQARVQELESVAADKQLIIDLLQKKNA